MGFLNDAFLSSEPWLLASICLSARFVVPGFAWLWVFDCSEVSKDRPFVRFVESSALGLTISFTLGLLITFLLGHLHLYSEWLELLLLGLITTIGVVMGCILKRFDWFGCLRSMVLTLLSVIVICSVVMSSSAPSEWLLGGWDPGLYTNEGIALEKGGTFSVHDDVYWDELKPEERGAFTRSSVKKTERFPGVSVDASRESFNIEFFRLTPSLVAVLHRVGGMDAVFRMNVFVGALVCLLMFTLLLRNASGPYAWFATIFLVAQPIWLYHAHLPVSEMLQLFIVLATWFAFLMGGSRVSRLLLISLMLMAGMLNRFTFMPFAGLMIAAFAWADIDQIDRKKVFIERCLQILAVIIGALIDVAASSASFAGWPFICSMASMSIAFVTIAFAIDLIASREKLKKYISALPAWLIWAVVGSVVLYFCWDYYDSLTPAPHRDHDNIARLIPYIGGYPYLLMLFAGALLLVLRRGRLSRGMLALILFMLCAAAVPMIRKKIMDIYPWATRRYLTYAVPSVALLCGYCLTSLWQMKSRYVCLVRGGAVLLLIVMLSLSARISRHAWRRTEYNGLTKVLAEIAGQTDDNDIVVVDHPWWGTPLTFVYGKKVLNARQFYVSKDLSTMKTGMAALDRLKASGRRVLFLTSTLDGLGVFPLEVKHTDLKWSSKEYEFQEIIHSKHGDDFQMRTRRHVFKLFAYGK